MNELFQIDPVKSPRLRWIEKHDIRRHRADLNDEDLPWSAWFPQNEDESGLPMDPEACGYSVTENDAMIDLAVKHSLRLWNEEQNVNVDLPDTAAQDSDSKSNSPAVSG